VPEPQQRRRGATLEAALLDAAWDELIEVGYQHVTMAGVAARAGTAKAVLYRRWPNRTELLAAAIDRRVPDLDEDPAATGDLRADLVTELTRLDERYRAVAAAPDPDGGLADHLLRQAAYTAIGRIGALLRHAVERGELAPADQLPRIVRLTVALLGSERRLERADSTADRLVEEIVDDYCLPLIHLHATP